MSHNALKKIGLNFFLVLSLATLHATGVQASGSDWNTGTEENVRSILRILSSDESREARQNPYDQRNQAQMASEIKDVLANIKYILQHDSSKRKKSKAYQIFLNKRSTILGTLESNRESLDALCSDFENLMSKSDREHLKRLFGSAYEPLASLAQAYKLTTAGFCSSWQFDCDIVLESKPWQDLIASLKEAARNRPLSSVRGHRRSHSAGLPNITLLRNVL